MLRFVLVGVGLFFVAAISAPAQAATLYLSPNNTELNRGDTIKLSIRLDVDEGECVNVVDAVVQYSNDIEPVDISRGTSIMSMWVEDPVINRDERTITFAGGIPNGYCGRIIGDPQLTNTIADLLFQSPGFVIGGSGSSNSSSTAVVNFAPETQILLNDGAGTRAPAEFYGATITLNPRAGNSINNEWQTIIAEDVDPPTPFSIILERTTNAFSNDYFITFNTTDKQSGIDHYEVMEEPLEELSLFNWGRVDAPWKEVRSPYVLKDQTLNSTIRVRAIDKAGNEYVATLIPDESQRTITSATYVLLAVIATGIVLVLLGLGWFLYRSRRRDSSDDELELEEEVEDYDDEEEVADEDEYEEDEFTDGSDEANEVSRNKS